LGKKVPTHPPTKKKKKKNHPPKKKIEYPLWSKILLLAKATRRNRFCLLGVKKKKGATPVDA